MERMDMHSRNEYLKVLKEGYFKAGSKKEKSQILDEYCRWACPRGLSELKPKGLSSLFYYSNILKAIDKFARPFYYNRIKV